MGRLIAFTLALSLFVILWAVGAKALDASLLPLMIILGAAAAYVYGPMLKPSDD